MIILLDASTCTVSEADVLTDLRVVTGAAGPEALGRAVRGSGLGALAPGDGTHVLLDVDALRSLARTSATLEDWDGRFDAMIAYAGRQGWLSDDGRSVRAHVERPA